MAARTIDTRYIKEQRVRQFFAGHEGRKDVYRKSNTEVTLNYNTELRWERKKSYIGRTYAGNRKEIKRE